MRLTALRSIFALMLAATAPFASGHGAGPAHAPPDISTTGLERGLDAALNCDHAIHELLFEYAACMTSNEAYVAGDPAATTIFRFVAWVRAAGAVYNGYADAAGYREQFRAAFLEAQSQHPLPEDTLCRALDIRCASLPEPVPRRSGADRPEQTAARPATIHAHQF